MLSLKELIDLFQDCIENKYVFNAVKEYVDWVVQDTWFSILYGFGGLAILAFLGWLASPNKFFL